MSSTSQLILIAQWVIGTLRRLHLCPGIARRCEAQPAGIPPGIWYEASSVWYSDGHSGSRDMHREYSMPVELIVGGRRYPISSGNCDWTQLATKIFIRVEDRKLTILIERSALGAVLCEVSGSEYISGDGLGSEFDRSKSGIRPCVL